MKWQWITYKGYRLRAPEGFDPSEIVGGCGPGKFGDRLVPNKILGVDIGPACDSHDMAYLLGETEEERIQADIELFANGFRIIKQASKYKIMSFLRAAILTWYFLAVAYGGEQAYYD